MGNVEQIGLTTATLLSLVLIALYSKAKYPMYTL